MSLPLRGVWEMAESSPGPPALPPSPGTHLRDLCCVRGKGSAQPGSAVLTLGLAPCGGEDGCTVRIMILSLSGNTGRGPRSADVRSLRPRQPRG